MRPVRTTLRRRRDELIELGVVDQLNTIVLDAYDRMIGLELGDVAVDGCITKAPCGGERAGPRPVDRAKQGTQAIECRRRQRHSPRHGHGSRQR